jgi:hypothetical protein
VTETNGSEGVAERHRLRGTCPCASFPLFFPPSLPPSLPPTAQLHDPGALQLPPVGAVQVFGGPQGDWPDHRPYPRERWADK